MEIQGEDQKLSLHQALSLIAYEGTNISKHHLIHAHKKKKISTLFHVGYLSQTLLNSLMFD